MWKESVYSTCWPCINVWRWVHMIIMYIYLNARPIWSYVILVNFLVLPQSRATSAESTIRNTPSKIFSHWIMEGLYLGSCRRSRMNSQSWYLSCENWAAQQKQISVKLVLDKTIYTSKIAPFLKDGSFKKENIKLNTKSTQLYLHVHRSHTNVFFV